MLFLTVEAEDELCPSPFVQQRSVNEDARREIIWAISILISMQYGPEKARRQSRSLRHFFCVRPGESPGKAAQNAHFSPFSASPGRHCQTEKHHDRLIESQDIFIIRPPPLPGISKRRAVALVDHNSHKNHKISASWLHVTYDSQGSPARPLQMIKYPAFSV